MTLSAHGVRHVFGSLMAFAFLACIVAGLQQTHPLAVGFVGGVALWGIWWTS